MHKTKILFAALLIAAPIAAFAASTINPTVPATNAQMSSAPIRNNFQASYNDITGIEGKFNGTSAPSNPINFQDWVDTTTASSEPWNVYIGGQWTSLGTFNCSGSPCTWSGGGGGGGTPGGSNTQLQYNNSGAFGGMSNTTNSSGFLKQTVTASTGTNTNLLEVVPGGLANNHFFIAQAGNTNPGDAGRTDEQMVWGYNIATTSKVVAGDQAAGWKIESYYAPASVGQLEFYMQLYGSDGSNFRPIFLTYPRDTNLAALNFTSASTQIFDQATGDTLASFTDTTTIINKSTQINAATLVSDGGFTVNNAGGSPLIAKKSGAIVFTVNPDGAILIPDSGAGGLYFGTSTSSATPCFYPTANNATSIAVAPDCSNEAIMAWQVIAGAYSVGLASNTPIGWRSTTTPWGALDTGLSRDAAGVIDVGTGAAGSTAGSMKMTGLTASGTITFAGVTTGTNADFACFAAGGVMTLQTSACTISSARFKTDIRPYRLALSDAVYRIPIITFKLKDGAKNKDPNAKPVELGMLAEDVAKIMPICAIYENDMKTPKSYRQECLIAALVKTVQEQHAANDNLTRRVNALERKRR